MADQAGVSAAPTADGAALPPPPSNNQDASKQAFARIAASDENLKAPELDKALSAKSQASNPW